MPMSVFGGPTSYQWNGIEPMQCICVKDRAEKMKPPLNIELPFFAYGLFRPGQLAFFQVRALVSQVADPKEILGSLLLRDGLPIIKAGGNGRVRGALLTFLPERRADAYNAIAAMEPDKQYTWGEAQVDGIQANVLFGRKPWTTSEPCEGVEWTGWSDPLFTVALKVVTDTLNAEHSCWDKEAFFRLQMAYLLLWSSIERYASLRYGLGENVGAKLRGLASEEAFARSVTLHVKERREVHRADRPNEKEMLDPLSNDSARACRYYYQVRSNITHRGKGVATDYDRIQKSLVELLLIFRDVLVAAESDAVYSA